MKVYVNEQLLDKEALSEVFEPGFLFGWGAFEVLRAYNGEVPFLEKHIERLGKNISLLGIEQPTLDFKEKISELLGVNNLSDAYIRITVYKKRKSTGVIIYADRFTYYPQSVYEKGFSAIASTYPIDTDSILWRVKSLSYLEKRLSWYQAQKSKRDEALVCNRQGFVVGGARSNLFLVKAGKIIVPSRECGVFDGITKNVVMAIVNSLDIDIVEEKITPESIYSCDEAFLSSSLLEVMPLVECENKALGEGAPGALTLRILSEYRKIINK
jgi:branched-subunit amino acid aminotransferase/4-amino-4-deoxychorismate lyase